MWRKLKPTDDGVPYHIWKDNDYDNWEMNDETGEYRRISENKA